MNGHDHPIGAIAIVGMACRLPGAEGPAQLWDLLRGGTGAIGALPEDRWPVHSTTSGPSSRIYAPWGGFVAEGDRFDRELFNISAFDAERMDPQQGMALELAWHALEDAGIAPMSMRGQSSGVYLGISTRDFDRRASVDWHSVDLRTALGACGSLLANRVSYQFGMCGPSLTVDVGCASSLASVHLATQALRLEECDIAMAGGIQLILSPANIIAFSEGALLAKDGRCKSFSDQADGYVCGEGGGMVVLKRLEDALRDKDRIYAVIRGSAINHNGASNGISGPMGASQVRLIQAALKSACLKPEDVSYVEAHSIGTPLGDTIEIGAIKSAFCGDRTVEQPCYVGSFKGSIGHLEAAAGIASLLKATLSVFFGRIPQSLHAEPLNPNLKLGDASPLRVAIEEMHWPDPLRRIAGVSAFSFGGGNAHLLIAQAPPAIPREPDCTAIRRDEVMLPMSASSPAALRDLAGRYLQFLTSQDGISQDFVETCHAAAVTRTHLKHRLAVVTQCRDTAVRALEHWLAGESHPALVESAGRKLPLSWQVQPGADAAALQPVLERLMSAGMVPGQVVCTPAQHLSLQTFLDQSTLLTAFQKKKIQLITQEPDRGDGSAGAAGPDIRVRLIESPTLAPFVLDQGLGIGFVMAFGYVHGGASIHWHRLWVGVSRRPLPAYPMQRARHWTLTDGLPPERGASALPAHETVSF